MFTSISWRIFEEARSKRVWSISSTFEYTPPFPPRAVLSFFPFLCFSPSVLLSLFLFFSSLLFRIYLNNLRPFGSLCVNYRLAKRAEESEMRERGERVGKFSKVLAEMRSVKGMRADNVDLPKDTRSDGLFVDSRIS